MIHAETIVRVECDREIGDEVFDVIRTLTIAKNVHMVYNTFMASKRIFEVVLDEDEKCIECMELMSRLRKFEQYEGH